VDRNLEGLATLRSVFADVVAGEERSLFEARVREIRELGADEFFSTRLITLRFLDQLLEILEIAREAATGPVVTANAYYRASELFDIPWLRRTVFSSARKGPWEYRAAQAMAEDLSRAHRRIVARVLAAFGGDGSIEIGARLMSLFPTSDVEAFREMLAQLREEDTPSLAAMSVATRELAGLADRLGQGPIVEGRR
jgi:NAD-specific glutamate dehydrogenase